MADNVASALCYVLGLLTGILFLVLEPYNRNKTVRFHAFQSIFFHIGAFVVWIVFAIVSMVIRMIGIPFLGGLLSLCMFLGFFVGWAFLVFSAYQGKTIEIPVIGELARKQA
jgi:uncharacterized membrane protein